MTARGTVRIAGLILALVFAGSAAAQVAPVQPADPVAVLDAMLTQPATADVASAPAAESDAPPDIISGVLVQAPPIHKREADPDEYSWAWNASTGGGSMISIHFGLNPTMVSGASPAEFGTPVPIVWRLSGRDIQLIVPKYLATDDAPIPEHTVSGTAPFTDSHFVPVERVFRGKLSADGDSMMGTFSVTGRISLSDMNPVLFQRWGDADPPGPAQAPLAGDETRVSIDAGRGTLVGTYRDPAGTPPGPAVLILPGSGPVNGDGDSMTSGPGPSNLRLIAEALDKAGYRSLRFDKRGIGDSSRRVVPQGGVKISDLVGDAANWARYLSGQPKVTCVVMLGHSEGALVAMLAAQKVKICGLVSLSGPGRTMGDTIRAQVEHADLSRTLKAQANTILVSLKAGKSVASVPEELGGLQPEAQPYLMSQINLDPAFLIQAVKAPVLIIQGDNDLQISVADAQRLAQARPDAQLLIVKNMNNATKIAPIDPRDNLTRSLQSNFPLAAPVMPAIIAFLEKMKP